MWGRVEHEAGVVVYILLKECCFRTKPGELNAGQTLWQRADLL